MNDQQRLIIFIALSGIILFGFNTFLKPKTVEVPVQETVLQESSDSQDIPQGALVPDRKADPIATRDNSNIAVAASAPKEIKALPEQIFPIENDLFKMSFSDIGGTISSVTLKKYSDSHRDADIQEPLELIPNQSSNSYMSLYAPDYKLSNTKWDYIGKRTVDSGSAITFSKEIKKGITVLRTYTIKEGTYLIDMDITIVNKTKNPAVIKDLQLLWGPNIHFLPANVKEFKDGFYQFNRFSYVADKKRKKIDINLKAKEDKLTVLDVKPEWVVLNDLYFMTSFIMKDTPYKSVFVKELTGGFGYMGLNFNDILVEGNSEQKIAMNSYIGPKEYKRLKAINMDESVDLGWMRVVSIWMFYAMDFLYKITKNYGVAILLLTLIIRGILWVPSQKSYKHMKETQQKMNVIKPRMETLKKVYKDDAQKLNEETMKLYKEYKINPFGGCLPMLLQIPIFIAFYQALMNMVELKGASFMLWMQDLSRPDPYYILPLFMGASMFIQQKMSQMATPAADDNAAQQQKIMLYGMPIFLTFLAFKWPSGLLLYWGMSNVLAIAQQFMVNKSK